MPISHIKYGAAGATHHNLISQSVQSLEKGKETLEDCVGTMALMINGDGTDVAHFTSHIIDAFGFPDATTAKAGFDELNSAKEQVNSIAAALNQLFNKFR